MEADLFRVGVRPISMAFFCFLFLCKPQNGHDVFMPSKLHRAHSLCFGNLLSFLCHSACLQLCSHFLAALMPKEKPLAPPECGLCRAPGKHFAFVWGACFTFGLPEWKIQGPGRSKEVEMSFTD